MKQFDFGENWSRFSSNALSPERVRQARADFATLMDRAGIDLQGQAFLDIGFGQGLSLLTACSMGASATGCDINPLCAQVLQRNREFFPDAANSAISVVSGSILEPGIVEELRQKSPGKEGFDVVHSWGVLHHTGNMWEAIGNAVSLVRPGGKLVIALYNRHWSSPAWGLIKRTYVSLPGYAQKALVGLLYPVIFGAKWVVTRRSPLAMDRGMDFYYNVIDWVGGYPYEYASRSEIIRFVEGKGFAMRATIPAAVPTGCNEFAFERLE
jgi:2-polyprenyl-3-methyl-5-hydroxy-6-metoxy-1,4-benzoquinol methylase